MSSYDQKSTGFISRLKTSAYSAVFTLLIYAIIVNFAPIPIANIFLNPMGVVAGVQYAQEKALASNAASTNRNMQKALASKRGEIFDKSAPFLGAENAQVQVVVFSDYRCGYCRKFDNVVESILKKPEYKDKVKFIIKELPVLGDASILMALGALEAFTISPDSYKKVHKALYEAASANGNEEIIATARKVGVKITLTDNAVIREKINNNRNLAKEMNIGGTPAIIIGDEFIPGFIGEEEMIARIQRELKK